MNQMKPLTKSQQFFRETRDYLMIALGMLMYGVGWTVFLLPNDIPSGAVVLHLSCFGQQVFRFSTHI